MVQVNYEDELECNKENCTIYNGVLVETCLEQADRQAGRQAGNTKKRRGRQFQLPCTKNPACISPKGYPKGVALLLASLAFD